jgi:putative acyl-CoA dehydrogenase
VVWPVGAPGRGVRVIIEMVNMTRLDCVIGTAAGMRHGLTAAAHHAAHRKAFGRYLRDQPLMANVLADLAVESEAATTVMTRLAAATDATVGDGDRGSGGDAGEAAFRRLALAVSKYWVCKRGPGHAAEALECLGGNGYVEESGMPRLYREAPLNSIWEGSGNVAALDVLRAMAREPASVEAFLSELDAARGADRRLDLAVSELRDELAGVAGEAADPAGAATVQTRARRLVERMALALQGALLVRYGHPAVADAFCVSRLGGDWGGAYGTLPAGVDFAAIVERATPKAS